MIAGVATTGALALASNVAGSIFTVSDASNIEKVIAECLRAGGGTVYFAAGTYRLDKRIELDLPRGTGLAFRGDGAGLTKLIWAAPPGGIEVRFHAEGGFGANSGAVLVENLSLLAERPECGSAIRLACIGGSAPSPKKLVRDVTLAGWNVGADCVDCTFTTIDDVDFQGAGGVAVRFDGTHDPVDNYVARLRVFGACTGIEVLGNCEGVYVSQCTMLGVERGIHWHTKAGEPLLSLSGSHIAASRDCIYGHNLIQPIISGNLLYQAGATDGEWAGVRLEADAPSIYDLLQVSHNTIHGFPKLASSQTGIVISKRRGGIIQGNVIHGMNAGIRLDEGTSEVNVLDNVVRGFTEADVVDRGSKNVIRRV